jgi:hypothetical protein
MAEAIVVTAEFRLKPGTTMMTIPLTSCFTSSGPIAATSTPALVRD